MKRLSFFTAALLAAIFTIPVHAAGKKHPATGQDESAAQATARGGNSLVPPMVQLSAGSFLMGSDEGDGDEKPVHRVTFNYAFEIGKTEVTQGQWRALMGDNPSKFNTCGDDCPVEQVSWEETQRFIAQLNKKTGKVYRLPTEAEWEYACRAGHDSTYCGEKEVGDMAWFKDNSGGKTMPVAKRQPNAWGIYDMSGNVYEWVQDDYHPNYKGAPSDGRAWEGGGKSRVLRGGSFDNIAQKLRAANRADLAGARRGAYDGFRIARTLP